MTIVFDIFEVIIEAFMILYVASDLILFFRNKKYQTLWNKEKADRVRFDPAITRAELCEQYVMFCKRNDCNVEF